ncbi:MAG: DUF4922 domain-containing protein [Tannerellaceae bacterium]|jgi:hypothetical protein|nr:DUF4922 domain-containing protein [Tannerellaceae bacterium]
MTLKQQALQLLAGQRQSWPLVKAGYEALEKIRIKSLTIDGFEVKVQYNPARASSSGAAVDPQSIAERPCFLCPTNLPPEQEALDIYPTYSMLCNPYPIFPEHFTIPSLMHTKQRIRDTFYDLIKIARQLPGFTLFYNGPRAGASAPDHLHFQAVTSSYMPLDNDAIAYRDEKPYAGNLYAKAFLLTGYRRGGIVIESTTEEDCRNLFTHIYNILPLQKDEPEPGMNIYCRYVRRWIVTVIPRRVHRPRQYYAQGTDHILTSPGAADIGGVFITSREEDYEKITPGIICDIYQQVAFSDAEIRLMVQA